eukprot:CAMPEP_0167792238 /NCGR_PEP_ID=MMETSP0111_2-20121227/12449_1 /TAXON_ID=91324 /ORGANISM="Lotharella globosa, Strain CCCM811" /LENGTH=47 /DNA_ID= /DNA_START= /DNA_END= /DNA_ORIENTATION=
MTYVSHPLRQANATPPPTCITRKRKASGADDPLATSRKHLEHRHGYV